MPDHVRKSSQERVESGPLFTILFPCLSGFLILIYSLLAFGGWLLHRHERQLEVWQDRLSSVAQLHRHPLNSWFYEPQLDTFETALFATTSTVVPRVSCKKATPKRAELHSQLESFARTAGANIDLIGRKAVALAHFAESALLSSELLRSCAGVIKYIITPRAQSAEIYAGVTSFPEIQTRRDKVVPRQNFTATGCAVLGAPPHSLASLKWNHTESIGNGERLIVAGDPNHATFISALRNRAQDSEFLSAPAAARSSLQNSGALFTEFRDYGEVPFLALPQFVPELSRAIVTKLDRSEEQLDSGKASIRDGGRIAFLIVVLPFLASMLWVHRRLQPFREALQQSAVGLAVTDKKGKFVLVNPAFSQLTGYDDNELSVLGWASLSHPEQRTQGGMDNASSGDYENGRDEMRCVTKTGTTLWIRRSMCAVRSRSGQTKNRIWFVEDITERKLAEARIRESEARFRTIYDNAGVGIAELGSDGRLLMINPAFRDMLGYSDVELVQRNIAEITHPEDWEQERKEFDSIRLGKRDSYTIGKRYLHRNGFPVWVAVTVSILPTSNQPTSYLCISADLTSHLEFEEEKGHLLRNEQKAKLDAECARGELKRMLERISDGFIVVDRDWRFRYVNTKAAQYLRTTEGELLGKNIWDHLDEESERPLRQLCAKALEQQVVIHEDLRIEPWKGWFETNIYPSIDGLTIIFRDMTKEKRASQELRTTLELLRALSHRVQQAREEERKRAARDLHDEIGQILTAIKLDIEWIKREGTAEPQRVSTRLDSTLSLLHTATESLRRICTELRPGVLDDLGLLAAVEWLARDFSARTGVQCDVSLPAEQPSMGTDCSTALFRILQEALTNVARHANATTVTVSVSVRAGKLLLLVQDDGKGILDSDLGASPGSLGLLGMKERAQACGGILQIWGEPGKGTTVAVEVPLAAVEQVEISDARRAS